MENRPIRKRTDHKIPWWLPNQGSHWMLTINCKKRNVNQLCKIEMLEVFRESIKFRNEQDIWRCSAFVLMPDHMHAIISLRPDQVLTKVVGNWKRWMAKNHGIQWQTNFHDHRIRCDESLFEKVDYILNNPVRAGLCEDYHDWKYLWLDKYNGEGLVDFTSK